MVFPGVFPLGARRKYKTAATTTVKTEEWKLELTRALKITDTHIFNAGIDSTLELVFQNGRVKSLFLERILVEKEAEIDRLNLQVASIRKALYGVGEDAEIRKQTRIKLLEQVCLDYFGEDLKHNFEKIGHEKYSAMWESLAEKATEHAGTLITPLDLQNTLKTVYYRQSHQGALA